MNPLQRRIQSTTSPKTPMRPRLKADGAPGKSPPPFLPLQEMLFKKHAETVQDIERPLGKQLNQETREQIRTALDVGDLSILNLADSIDLSLLEMKDRTLKGIEEAIRRLKENNYGLCEECRRRIHEGRLRVKPFATTCIACQEKRELFEKIESKEENYS